MGDKLDNSDHNILYCTLPLRLTTKYTPKNSPVHYQYRDYKNADWELLSDLLRSSDWEEYFINSNLEISLEILYKTTGSARDTIAPLKSALKTLTPFIDRKTRLKLKKLKRKYYILKEFNALNQIHETLKLLEERHKMMSQLEENKALGGKSKLGNFVGYCRNVYKTVKKIM